jgi:glycosyltransferase involved in cell wall biosynthesis
MGEVYRRAYGADLDYVVVHPPARSTFPWVPWERRVDDFVCIARMSPEKRIEEAVRILGEVRRRGHPVRLRILTAGGKWAYTWTIRTLMRRNADWISIARDLTDEEYRLELARHKYGINAARTEGFGIAVAELINAGCIPFVAGSGGQSEVVGHCDAVRFTTPEEGVERILAVLSDDALQADILGTLRCRQGLFSADRFQREIREIVRTAVAASDERPTPGPHLQERIGLARRARRVRGQPPDVRGAP